MKKIKAVAPYAFGGKPGFKHQPYEAWVNIGGRTAKPHYPPKVLHSLAYNVDFPSLCKCGKEARLRFVEPVALSYDAFPDYMFYEIIPLIWDCWPQYFGKVAKWLKRHDVRTAIFTSSQTADLMRKEFPDMNILSIPEGINVTTYHAGKNLAERNIDLLEYGSIKRNFFQHYVAGIKHINSQNANGCMRTFSQLLDTMADAKITISLPRCDTAPEETGGFETLTQRFWEVMLSRSVLLGRAPKELIDLVGYNPVVTIDKEHADEQVRDIVEHISEYQDLVDKNRETALNMAPWEIRMKQIMEWLEGLGYEK